MFLIGVHDHRDLVKLNVERLRTFPSCNGRQAVTERRDDRHEGKNRERKRSQSASRSKHLQKKSRALPKPVFKCDAISMSFKNLACWDECPTFHKLFAYIRLHHQVECSDPQLSLNPAPCSV